MSRFLKSPDVRFDYVAWKTHEKRVSWLAENEKQIKNNEIFTKVWTGPMIYARMFLSSIHTKRSHNASLAKIWYSLYFNEVKPRGTLFLLEPLSINALVFAFVQKSLRSHPWLFSWGWDKTMLSARKKTLLTADMRILDKENVACRCMAFHPIVTAERSIPKEVQIS